LKNGSAAGKQDFQNSAATIPVCVILIASETFRIPIRPVALTLSGGQVLLDTHSPII